MCKIFYDPNQNETKKRRRRDETEIAVNSSTMANFIRLHFMSLKSNLKYSLITPDYDMFAYIFFLFTLCHRHEITLIL